MTVLDRWKAVRDREVWVKRVSTVVQTKVITSRTVARCTRMNLTVSAVEQSRWSTDEILVPSQRNGVFWSLLNVLKMYWCESDQKLHAGIVPFGSFERCADISFKVPINWLIISLSGSIHIGDVGYDKTGSFLPGYVSTRTLLGVFSFLFGSRFLVLVWVAYYWTGQD